MVIVTSGADALARAAGSYAFTTCLQDTEAVDRRLNRIPSGLAEPADRGILHHETDIAQQADVASLGSGILVISHNAQQRFLLAHRAHAARHALAAGFVAEEPRDAQKNGRQIDGVI